MNYIAANDLLSIPTREASTEICASGQNKLIVSAAELNPGHADFQPEFQNELTG